MDVHAAQLAVGLDEQERLLAERKHRGAAEKMRGYCCAARRNCARSFDDRDGFAAGVGHGPVARSIQSIPSPLWGGVGVGVERLRTSTDAVTVFSLHA